MKNMNLHESLRFPSSYQGICHVADGPALLSSLNAALTRRTDALRITSCGLLKAGKSSLLNALTDHLETELFATGAARTTVRNQTLSHQDFVFIDTPGLDATTEDDGEAWAGLNQADVLLFVHHPGTGELHREEMDFLANLARQPGARQTLAQRMVVVLSHLDTMSHEIAAIEKRVLEQIRTLTGSQPRCFRVSFTSYKKGMLQKKSALVEYSGIPALRSYLTDHRATLRAAAESLHSSRIHESRQRLLDAIDQAMVSRQHEAQRLKTSIERLDAEFSQNVTRLFSHLRSKIAAYHQSYRGI